VERAFQVDLRGVVDLLSHHLYASPRVYLRELLQNAVDAITARQLAEPEAPALVSIEPPELTGDGTLRVSDSGIGLTESEVHELLATIGRSSKKDDLGFARREFLGQFGIGLLSCFLVADEIRVGLPAPDAARRGRSRAAAGVGVLRPLRDQRRRAASHR
jgi:molecular chaperone HtpG